MGKGVKTAVVGGVFAVMVGGAGYGVYNIVSAVNGDGGSGASAAATKKTGPPDKVEVEETTRSFLAAWEKGEASQAASYTNNAQEAGALLTAYGDEARVGDVEITPGTAAGATVPFTVEATVSYD